MASHPAKEEGKKFWLTALYNKTASINAYSCCLCTADLEGSGDYQLIIADGNKRLKVYENVHLQSVTRLPGVASGVIAFHSHPPGMTAKRVLVAVAVCQHILVYHNFKPYYRFTVPPIRAPKELVSAWDATLAGAMSVDELVETVQEWCNNSAYDAHGAIAPLPRVVRELLSCETAAERQMLLERTRGSVLEEPDVVTSLAAIPMQDLKATELSSSALVYGTEKRQSIGIVTPHDMQIVTTVVLPATPVFILTRGSLRVDYDVVVSCRDGCVYHITNGVLQDDVIHPEGQPVAMTHYNAWIVVATVRQTMGYYTRHGRCVSQVRTSSRITNLVTLTDAMTGAAQGLIVALETGQIDVYVGTQLHHSSSLHEGVTALIYSRYGREDAAMMAVLQSGSLVINMLHRKVRLPQLSLTDDLTGGDLTAQGDTESADSVISSRQPCRSADPAITDKSAADAVTHHLGKLDSSAWATHDQNVLHKLSEATPSVPIPSLCSLFDTHTEQEKKQAVDGYYVFQHNMCVLRLHTARAYRDMLLHNKHIASVRPTLDSTRAARDTTESTTMDAPSAVLYALHNTQSTLQLTTTILGSRPTFRVRVRVINDGATGLLNLTLIISAIQRLYHVSRSIHTIAYLAPSMKAIYDVVIRVNEDETTLEPIWIYVAKESGAEIIASSSIELPEGK